MSNILTTFLKETYYQGQISHRLQVLRSFLLKHFFNASQVQISQLDSDWLKSLGDDFLKNFTQQAGTSGSQLNVYQVLEKLEKDVKKLPTLTVYLPFEMPDEEKNKLGLYLRTNFKKDLIFEIKLDPDLIGGAALSWKGVHKDYSLRERIDQNHDKVLSSLKSFST